MVDIVISKISINIQNLMLKNSWFIFSGECCDTIKNNCIPREFLMYIKLIYLVENIRQN